MSKQRSSEFYQKNIFTDDGRFEWFEYQTKVPPSILAKKSRAFDLSIPVQKNWNDSDDRMLIVVEHVDSEDLKSKYLLSSREGVVLTNLIREVGTNYRSITGESRTFAFAAVNFNYCKTYHLDSADQSSVEKLAAKRIDKIIKKLKPTHILFIGDSAAARCLDIPLHQAALQRGWLHNHESGAVCVSTLDITDMYWGGSVSDDDDSDDSDDSDEGDYGGDSADRTLVAKANLLGFVMRNMLTLWFNKLPFSIRKIKPNSKLVQTIEAFDSMMEELQAANAVAVDTETRNLGNYNNALLIIQFATTTKYGYVLPVHHPDAVWTKKEIRYIENKLRDFFAQQHPLWSGEDTKYLIFHNASFDLRVLRRLLAIPVIYWPVWDTMAGEFLLDENFNATRNYGVEYGKLGGLCCLYGNDFYFTKEGFSKDDRDDIEGQSLEDQNFIDYCTFDVQSIFGIHKQQRRYASTMEVNGENYLDTYLKFNLVQMSAIAHDFSHMVEVGVPVDLKWLLHLLGPKSPVNDAIKSLRAGFKDFDSIKEANKLLSKGIQTNGLFGKVQPWVFDPSKADHVKTWMFEALKLEPVVYTKTGEPGTGKALQSEYKAIPEVAHYTRYKKTIHLKRSFLGPFYKHVAETNDGRVDYRIRPGYGYLDVVTGRSNSFKPSLQQVPQRTEEAKLLKRAFVAGTREQRRIVIKLDYNTHEVRGWAIAAFDYKLGAQFKRGRILRSQFMQTEDESLLPQIKLSDLHRINVGLFFGVDIATMDPKELELLRDLVKAIVFGSIYGRSVKSIARATNRPVEEVQKVYDKFFKRYQKGGDWLADMKAFALSHLHAYSPLGRRRSLWGYLTGAEAIIAANGRQSINSPIQGMGADIAHLASRLYTIELFKVFKHFGWIDSYDTYKDAVNADYRLPVIEVMVHDSSRTTADLDKAMVVLQLLNWVYTTGTEKALKQYFNMDLVCPLEVEFEIGPDDAHLKKWNWSISGLEKLLREGFENAKKEDLIEDLDVDQAMQETFYDWRQSKARKFMDKNYPWFSSELSGKDAVWSPELSA